MKKKIVLIGLFLSCVTNQICFGMHYHAGKSKKQRNRVGAWNNKRKNRKEYTYTSKFNKQQTNARRKLEDKSFKEAKKISALYNAMQNPIQNPVVLANVICSLTNTVKSAGDTTKRVGKDAVSLGLRGVASLIAGGASVVFADSKIVTPLLLLFLVKKTKQKLSPNWSYPFSTKCSLEASGPSGHYFRSMTCEVKGPSVVDCREWGGYTMFRDTGVKCKGGSYNVIMNCPNVNVFSSGTAGCHCDDYDNLICSGTLLNFSATNPIYYIIPASVAGVTTIVVVLSTGAILYYCLKNKNSLLRKKISQWFKKSEPVLGPIEAGEVMTDVQAESSSYCTPSSESLGSPASSDLTESEEYSTESVAETESETASEASESDEQSSSVISESYNSSSSDMSVSGKIVRL